MKSAKNATVKKPRAPKTTVKKKSTAVVNETLNEVKSTATIVEDDKNIAAPKPVQQEPVASVPAEPEALPETKPERPMLTPDYFREHHYGRNNAIYGPELARIFNVSERGIRERVNTMRMDGNPICSGPVGYFWAATKDEIVKAIDQLDHLKNGIENARAGLVKALENFDEENAD